MSFKNILTSTCKFTRRYAVSSILFTLFSVAHAALNEPRYAFFSFSNKKPGSLLLSFLNQNYLSLLNYTSSYLLIWKDITFVETKQNNNNNSNKSRRPLHLNNSLKTVLLLNRTVAIFVKDISCSTNFTRVCRSF